MNRALAALTCLLCALPLAAQSLNFDAPISLGNINTDLLTEASGIVASRFNPGVFWTHNDGPRSHLFAFRMDGALLADFNFGGAPLDVEDIATGPGPDASHEYIYLGDVGSNSATRDTIAIYRVQEPAVDPNWVSEPVAQDIVATTFFLKYPDGTYDCEAIFVDPLDNTLYVATKQTGTCRIYAFPVSQLIPNQTHNLQFLLAIAFDRVNAGDISRDGKTMALRRGGRANGWIRNEGETIAQTLARDPTRIPLATEPNGEAIAFLPDNSGYITLSEGVVQPIYFVRNLQPCTEIPHFTAIPTVAPDGLLLNFSACPGTTLAIERSSDLTNWSEITTVPIATGPASYKDTQFTAPAFYRLRLLP
jgi:hypothetical protein